MSIMCRSESHTSFRSADISVKVISKLNNRSPSPKKKSPLRTVKAIKRFLLFQYSEGNISSKKGICQEILSALEGD